MKIFLFLLLLLPAVLGQTLITVEESLTSTAITNGQTNDVPDVTRFPTQDPTVRLARTGSRWPLAVFSRETASRTVTLVMCLHSLFLFLLFFLFLLLLR